MSLLHVRKSCLACIALLLLAGNAWGDDPPAPPVTGDEVDSAPTGTQPADPGAEVLPRNDTPEGIARRESLSWLMTGQLYESRRDLERAVEAFRKSVEADPSALVPYQKLLPLLLLQGETEQAREYALQAAEHSTDGLQVVRALGAVLNQQGQTDEAIELFQQALTNAKEGDNRVTALLLHRDLGLLFHTGGDKEKAAENLTVVLAALESPEGLTPEEINEVLGDDPAAMCDVIGQALLAVNDAEGAVRAFEKAAEYAPEGAAVHGYNLAQVFRQKGEAERGLEELNKYLNAQLQARGRAPYQLLKDLLADLDRGDELLPWLEKLAEADPNNAELQYFLAHEYVLTDDLDKAEELYRRVLADTNAPQGIVGLIPIHRQKKQTAELLTALVTGFSSGLYVEDEAELETIPADFRYLAEQFNDEIKSLAADEEAMKLLMEHGRSLEESDPPTIEFAQVFVLAQLAVEAKRTEDVLHNYRLAIDMRNDPPAVLYRELSNYLIDEKEYTDAIKILNEAAEHPSNELQQARWQFLYFLSFAYELDGQTDPALEAVRGAREEQPDEPVLQYQEGWVYYHAHRWEDAQAIFEGFIAEHGDDPSDRIASQVDNCRFNLSNIFVQTGDLERGEQVLLEVLETNPDNVQANNDLGYLWADQNKRLDEARVMIEKALAAEPENAAYLDSMGWVLYRLEDYAGAVAQLEKAIGLPNGGDSVIQEHLADCYEKLDRHDEARDLWQKALDQEREQPHPDAEVVQRIEEKLAE